MIENIDRIMELFNSGIGKTNVARTICEEQGIEFNHNHRRSVGKLINRRVNSGINQECEAVGIDIDKVKHYWHKGEHYSINVKAKIVHSTIMNLSRIL